MNHNRVLPTVCESNIAKLVWFLVSTMARIVINRLYCSSVFVRAMN